MSDYAHTKLTGTGGRLLLEQMKASEIEYLFTNPGSSEVGLFDALHDVPDIAMIVGLHEGVVMSMADGYARVTGKVGFVNVHTIAGTAQMAGQLTNAFRDHVPVVVTAGLRDNELFNDDAILGPSPGFNQKEVNRQFTKRSWEIRDAVVVPHALRRAIKVSTTQPTGPTYVAFTADAFEAAEVVAEIIPQRYFTIPGGMRPNADLVAQAAEMVVAAERPVMMVGDGVTSCGAEQDVFEFAELLGIPVTFSYTAYRNFPSQHGLNCGRRGSSVYGEEHGDLLISVGANSSEYTNSLADIKYPRQPRRLAIHVDPENLGRTAPMNLAIVADIKEAMRDLNEAVRSRLPIEQLLTVQERRTAEITACTGSSKEKCLDELNQHFMDVPIHPSRLGHELEQVLDPDTIVVNESFTGDYDMMTFGHRPGEKRWVGTSGGSLGWGIGAAIGVKLGQPDRPVVCSIGDGATMFSAAGFWTMARYHIPLLTVIWNNLNYQIVRWQFAGHKGVSTAKNAYPGLFLGDPDIDFVELAHSQGVDGERVTRPEDIRLALERGLTATREGYPYVIDVIVARTGAGADSTWYQDFNLAERRTRKV